MAIATVAPKAESKESSHRPMTSKEREQFIRKAKVWVQTPVSEMDLRAGPEGPGAFAPEELVTCDYVESKLSGSSRKFDCAIAPDDVVKVRYGETNPEVQGSVLASRLLWALGFGADRVYPVRVLCRGCSSDPWVKRKAIPGSEQLFESAAIERKAPGHPRKVKSKGDEGWSWDELPDVNETQGGATWAERDALKLLAVLIQHTDNKRIQQRLHCLPGGLTEDDVCQAPFLMLHDLGLTFGKATLSNSSNVSSVNFSEWSKMPIWRGEARACIGHLSHSYTATLWDPVITERGRAFLAQLLIQLSDDQLHDLFVVARVEKRRFRGDSAKGAATVDEWVVAFKHKRDEIVNNHCP